MTTRQTYSLEQIKERLLEQVGNVVEHYAPRVQSSHTDTKGRYFTLNPGRADRSVGSFYVQMHGAKAGHWTDLATGEFGDILDLIALNLRCDLKDALREARTYLGLQTESPEDRARRDKAAQKAKADRQAAEQRDRENAARRVKQAQAIFLSAQENLRGTPVEYYLRDQRAIDLAKLGRQPRALRYLKDCRYYDVDPETGEVIEGCFPAMVAAVSDFRGRMVAVHRTWLAIGPDGRWDKAPVPKPKKVLGNFAGAAINIWRGTGPRGGKPASLPQCPPDTHVMMSEGIEDALSTVVLLPDARVIAGISLGNLGQVVLPANVSTLTLVADLDEGGAAQAALQRAIAAHQKAGRTVRLFQNQWGGKDLNDALRDALRPDNAPASDEEEPCDD